MTSGWLDLGALFGMEQQLMDPIFRRDRERVGALLADEFREFGASGRVWAKTEILHLLEKEEGRPPAWIEDFAVEQLAPGIALVTYRAVRGNPARTNPVSTQPVSTNPESQQADDNRPAASADQVSLRSSVWITRDGRWQMIFHQGTRMQGVEAPEYGTSMQGLDVAAHSAGQNLHPDAEKNER